MVVYNSDCTISGVFQNVLKPMGVRYETIMGALTVLFILVKIHCVVKQKQASLPWQKLYFQHVESLPSEDNIFTTFLQGWEQRFVIFLHGNGQVYLQLYQ